MAAILQLRRGALTDFNSYGTNVSEPYFDTSRDTLHLGTTDGTGSDADWITLVKLSQANRDFTKNEPNTGSLWLTSGSDGTSGNYTGSNMILYNNIIISGSGFIEGDLHLEGHLFLGSGSDDDVVRVQSEFSGSIVPDNDITGSTTPDSTIAYYDLGTTAKRYRNIFLQKDGTNAGFLSGSHIDLTGNIKVDGEGQFGTLRVDDLTDNRILLAGVGGEVEDDGNLTYDGNDFNLSNSDFHQVGSGASFQFDGAGMEISGSISNYQLRVDNGVVFTNEFGTLDNQSQFTWDGGILDITGGVSASEDISVGREAYLASAIVKDLTNDRIVIAGTNGEIEDDQYFRFTGNNFIVGDLERFKVQVSNGNTFISGAVQMFSTLDVDGQSTHASLNVEDLTDNRVVIVGAGGEIEDDGNFTFNGTELNIGTGNFTVQQGSGNTQILGTLDVDSQSTLSSLNVQDLTDNRIVIAGTSGEIEDDANLTFNGTELNIGTGNFTVQQGSGNTQILGILDVDSQSTLSSVNVQDLTSGRVVLAGTSGEIEDSGNLTFDGSLLTVTGDTIVTGNLTIEGTQTQLNTSTLNVEDKNILIASGAVDASAANGGGITIDGADATILYSSANDSFQLNKQLQVEGNISGSSFGGTTLLSSSNENFADYSQSVDTRLDSIEGPMSTSLDSRLIEIFATGSDHETRLDAQELHSSSFTSNDLDMNGNKVLFGNVYSAEGDLPAAGTYHGMFAHVHGTGKGYFAHGGNWIPLLNESTFTTDSASFDSRIDAQESFSTSLDDTFATEAEVNSATSSLSSSLAVDIASNLSEITNLNSFSSSIETYLPTGTISGSSQVDVEYNMLDSSFTARAANVTLSSGTTSAIIDFTSSAIFEITTPTDSTATTLNFDNAEVGMSKMILIVNQSTAGSGTITLGQTTGTGTFIRTSSDDIVRTLSTTNYLQITCIAASGDDRTFVYTVGTAQ